MTSDQFCFWAQGFFELTDAKSLDEKQTQILKDHLALVFNKVTPNYYGQDYGGIKLLNDAEAAITAKPKFDLKNLLTFNDPYLNPTGSQIQPDTYGGQTCGGVKYRGGPPMPAVDLSKIMVTC